MKNLCLAVACTLAMAIASISTFATSICEAKSMNPDEAAITEIVGKIQSTISSSDWDAWVALYTDDAVFTAGKNEVTKAEIRKMIDGADYKITKQKILKMKIDGDKASVSTSFLGNGKENKETYLLRKEDGKWLIYKEQNP